MERVHFVDDSWLGEHAYWLSVEGYVKSDLFAPLLDYKNQLFVYHKLFTYTTTLFVHTLGFGLLEIRILIFLSLATIIGIIIKHNKWFSLDRNQSLVAASFILLNPILLNYGTIYRPELMVTMLGLASYLALHKFLDRRHNRHLFFSSLFAGLATLTHLNGVIFIAAGVILLFARKQAYQGIAYGLIATLVITFYFTDVVVYQAWDTFSYQFVNDPALFHKEKSIWANIIYLFDDHKRWFHDVWISIFSICSVLLAGVWLSKYKSSLKLDNLLVYTLLLAIFLAFISPLNTTKYTIYIIPFISILWCRALSRIGNLKSVQLILTAYLISGVVQSVFIVVQPKRSFQEIRPIVQPGARIIAPMEVLFEEMNPSFHLGLHYAIHFHNKYNGIEGKLSKVTLLEEAEKWDIDYIIIPRAELYRLQDLDYEYNKFAVVDLNNFVLFRKLK